MGCKLTKPLSEVKKKKYKNYFIDNSGKLIIEKPKVKNGKGH